MPPQQHFGGDSRVSPGRSAFTLLELVAVIAVLVILAVILIPAIQSVRDKARMSKTVSNLRQSTTAYLLLVQDSGGTVDVFRGGYNSAENWGYQLFRKDFIDGGNGRKALYAADRDDSAESGSWHWWTFGLNLFADNVETRKVEGDNGDTSMASINYMAVQDPANYLLMANSVYPGRSDFESGDYVGSFRLYDRGVSEFGSIQVWPGTRTVPVATLDGAVTMADLDRLARLGVESIYDENGEVIDLTDLSD